MSLFYHKEVKYKGRIGTDRQTNRQTERQADSQRQRGTETERVRDRERQSQKEAYKLRLETRVVFAICDQLKVEEGHEDRIKKPEKKRRTWNSDGFTAIQKSVDG